eukprot:449559_1
MTIKKFNVSPKLSVSYEKETIDKLVSAVNDIHNQRGGTCSFEELYRSCSSLCSLKKGNLIYDKLYNLCDFHIENRIYKLVCNSDNNSSDILSDLCIIWDNHRSEMHAIRQVFLMLDRTYVRQGLHGTEIKSLWKMGIYLLKKHILSSSNNFIISQIISSILLKIEFERRGEEIDNQLIKTCIIMIAHLNIYKNLFEKELIISTNKYYEKLASKLILSLTIPDYINIVIKSLNDEHIRCCTYLDSKTQRYLSIAIEQQMINKHSKFILEKGFNNMCNQMKINDLRHLYKLFVNVNKLSQIKKYFNLYSQNNGLNIIGKSSRKNNEIIVKLLIFKNKLDTIISQSFDRNKDFKSIIRKSWEYFMNNNNIKESDIAELIAKYIDYQLQTGARGTSETELENTLDGVMDIFRFVHGKDVFQAFYKKDLAKRLLLNTSSSSDAEKNMINRIRKECGQSYASNLENMFKDIDISIDLNNKFINKHLQVQHKKNAIEFKFNVLTSGCWPTYNTDIINLPKEINKQLSLYNNFYIRINSGRKLNWTSNLSHCIMAANFPKGRKELVLSAFQATVLLLFNQKNKLNFTTIKNKTNINEKELKKTMLSLVKGNILLKKTKGIQINNNEEFKLNAKYENRLRRVKVNQIQIIETKQEITKTTQKIKKDRQYQIDACIVRVMKARKQLFHQQLMAQCLKQLKFDAIPKQIKKRIEALIENEYLERDKKNNNLYHYKA